MPIQGSTISSDLQIAGPKIFSDASWKCSKIPGRPIVPATGIGVYLQVPDDGIGVSIMIQASTAQANSPLMAEAAAMLLASLSAKALNLHGVTFLSDNLSLTKAAAARNITSSLVNWEIRNQLAQIFSCSSQLQASFFHISRKLNGIAHNCAHQVLTSSAVPTFSCVKPAHKQAGCPFLAPLSNLVCTNFVIHAVLCF